MNWPTTMFLSIITSAVSLAYIGNAQNNATQDEAGSAAGLVNEIKRIEQRLNSIESSTIAFDGEFKDKGKFEIKSPFRSAVISVTTGFNNDPNTIRTDLLLVTVLPGAPHNSGVLVKVIETQAAKNGPLLDGTVIDVPAVKYGGGCEFDDLASGRCSRLWLVVEPTPPRPARHPGYRCNARGFVITDAFGD